MIATAEACLLCRNPGAGSPECSLGGGSGPMQGTRVTVLQLCPTTTQSSVYLQLQVFPEGKPDVLRTFS